MIFSSYTFLFIFLPIVFIGYTIFSKFKLILSAKIFFILCSFYFYWYGSESFFPFFVLSVFLNYAFGYVLGHLNNKNKHNLKKLTLVLAILWNVCLLGYYKYTDFFIENFNWISGSDIPLKHIILPIGISFFTFQLIGYIVDSYRGLTFDYSVIDYLMFITFFPQLIVGPIIHHKDVVPQFENKDNYSLKLDNLSLAIFIFSIGMAKKLVIADSLTTSAQFAFDSAFSLNMLDAWLASVSYTISYYFDLSGYADMAIGLGLLFNINIPINFNSPYKARNFADYWRRWHITLSRFLGDYIFRSIYKKGSKNSKLFYFAVFITFLVSGFWHGAGWNFIVWGVFNGIFVMMSHWMTRKQFKLPFLLAWFLTFTGVVLMRVLFVASSLESGIHVIKTMFDINKFATSLSIKGFGTGQLIYLIAGIIIAFFFKNTNQMKEKFKPSIFYALFIAFLLFISVINLDRVGDFLYFQF